MVVHGYRARLLSPLTYHSVPDAGAAGATVTAPILGDVAVTYAIHHAVAGAPIPFRFGRRGPDHAADYAHFRTIASVGVPSRNPTWLPPEFVASSFMSEGFEQKDISPMESKHRRSKVNDSPWRPWRQIQSLAPGNEFTFVTVGEELPDTFTFRTGLGRGCLVHAVRSTERPHTAAINRYTVETLLSRSIEDVEHETRQTHLSQYEVWSGVPIETVERLLQPVKS